MSEGGTRLANDAPDYKYERARLATFSSWPANAKVEAWKMARAGLLYTGEAEEVRCLWCGLVLTEWQFGDQVMARHRLASPQCPFVLQTSDNVPATSEDTVTTSNNNNTEVSVSIPEDTDDVGLSSPRQPRLLHPASHLPPHDTEHQEDAGPTSPEGPVEADYRSEAVRLASFSNWTVPYIRPTDLARAGFYSLHNLDSCKCAFCDNCVGDWVEGDDPMTEHTHLFPLCPFVLGYEVGNIPLNSDEHNPGEGIQSQDETGMRWSEQHREPNSAAENALPGEELGVMKHGGPLHPQYATLEARLRTFREWPPALRQKPRDLAEAGFYYIGLSDQVKCFYCDGGLRNWQSEDEPWKEHARWFQKCVFVRLVKGDGYIAECLKERPPEGGEELSPGPRSVSEDEVRRAMSQAIVKQVLSMGIDASRVKMAIKKRLENSGNAFDTTESLISAAFSVQRNQERRSHNENLNPSGAMLGRLGESSRSSGVLDMVSERWGEWGVGQASQDRVSMETEDTEQSQSQEVNISLDRSPASARLAPPTPEVSGCQSAPASPSVTSPEKTEEMSPPAPVTSKSNDDLESENARLKEQRTCKICMDKEVGVVFLPCGHLCCCVNCAPALKDCPVCRRSIQGTVRTFMS